MFFQLFDQPGVHLARQFEIITALVFVPLFFWLRGRIFTTSATEDVLDVHLLTILFIWALLAAYHRLYDTLVLLLFIVLIFKSLANHNIWKLNKQEQTWLLMFTAILPLILVVSARIVDKVLNGYYGTVSDEVTTIPILILLAISIRLLR